MPKPQLIRLKHELLLLHEEHCCYCFAPIEANECKRHTGSSLAG